MRQTPRILVVEDDFLIADLIEEILTSAGCEVVGPVRRVADAVHTAAHAEYDAAVLDVNVAGERIYPVADALCERTVPFLFLTGYDGASLEPRFRSQPRLGKPFRARDLLSAVRLLVPQPTTGES